MKYSLSRIKKWIILLLIVIVFTDCGQRSAPTGGPKDNTPPAILKRIPDSLQTNYVGKTISLKFDEYFKVSGFQNEFLISPPINCTPSYSVKGKKLIIKFDSTFAENTTYTVFLGEAIKDLNEGNILKNNLIVFSTGDVIDSLTFSGNIVDAKTMEPYSGGMVHLYKSIDDSVPSKEIPSYFAKIENGTFTFKNLAPGKYKIFALKDNNGNYKYDLPNEEIAFLTEPIVISADTVPRNIVLKMFNGAIPKQYIKSTKIPYKGKMIFTFNLPVKTVEVNELDKLGKKDQTFLQWNSSRDSLIYWSTQMLQKDSLYLEVIYDGFRDTIKRNISTRKLITDQPLYVTASFGKQNNNHTSQKAFIFSQPVISYDSSKIILFKPADTVNVKVTQNPENSFEVSLNNKLKEATEYKFQVLPNAFESVFNITNQDTVNFTCFTAPSTIWGNLNINYNFSAVGGQGILIVFKNGKILKTEIVYGEGKLNLKMASPGKYKLQYILDADENKEWTTGDYWNSKQPENVFWYTEPIELRANWDLDVNWTLNPK